MFIRYNLPIKFWEYDTSIPQDGTGPWVLLPVDGSKVAGGAGHHATHEPGGSDYLVNSVWTNVANIFTAQLQTANINPSLLIGGRGSSFPALRSGVNQLEVVSADGPPASVWMTVQALNFKSAGTGNNLTDLTVGNQQCNGFLNVVGRLTASEHILSGQYMYPGAVTNPGVPQTNWYLGSHSSFGLFTNTGLYVTGPVWAIGGMDPNYLLRETAPFDFTITTDGGWSVAAQHAAIAYRHNGFLHVTWMCDTNNGFNGMAFRIPGGFTAQRYAQSYPYYAPSGYPPTYGSRIEVAPGDVWIRCYYTGDTGPGRYSGQVAIYTT